MIDVECVIVAAFMRSLNDVITVAIDGKWRYVYAYTHTSYWQLSYSVARMLPGSFTPWYLVIF